MVYRLLSDLEPVIWTNDKVNVIFFQDPKSLTQDKEYSVIGRYLTSGFSYTEYCSKFPPIGITCSGTYTVIADEINCKPASLSDFSDKYMGRICNGRLTLMLSILKSFFPEQFQKLRISVFNDSFDLKIAGSTPLHFKLR